MKLLITFSYLFSCCLIFSLAAQSQTTWPQTATASDGTVIKMYEWQTESFSDNTLKARAAISVTEKGNPDPVFGVAWLTATLQNSSGHMIVQSVHVNTLKLPGESLQDNINPIQTALEKETPDWNLSFSKEELNSSLKLSEQQNNLSKTISNTPPEIIYSRQPSLLVSIDGSPKLQQNSEWGVETVINSPFTIIKNKDGNFYLYGGKHWYSAQAATGPYTYSQQVPQNLSAIESAINETYKKNDYTISSIIVSTSPAELIQTNGEASFAAVQGTALLYVSNTDDDIFIDVNTQNYYVLLSGRWYKSKTLSGQWQYIEADKLPADFAKIPSGSDKEEVLASVAGTDAAQHALEDAQLPQTAKVDRNNTSVDVIYDGDPEFESIEGTSLQYATNSPFSVVRYRNSYYAVDNGVWFESRSARGPWIVSVQRPYEIALIPPRYPVYNMKYVYIYDVAPDYVYMGYTPGYLNAYTYGPTVVYGTGYYYRPWHRKYYYPRPSTWGYNMRYSPWVGWGFGANINIGWFSMGIGNHYGGYSRGGWWGPSAYRPNYCYRGKYAGFNNNYYGNRRNTGYINHNYINRNNNVYNNRRGISTRDSQRFSDNRRNDWANNNSNRNSNSDRINRSYNNRDYNNSNRDNNNNSGRINNNNRNSNNNSAGNNGTNNRQQRQYNPGNINSLPDRTRDTRIENNNRLGNSGNNNTARDRQYNPGNNNVFPDRTRNNNIGNNNNNRSIDNNRQREVQRSDRQYQPPATRENNRGNNTRVDRSSERTGSGSGGGNVNNNGNRSTERRESGGGQQNNNNSSNNRGSGGRRGG